MTLPHWIFLTDSSSLNPPHWILLTDSSSLTSPNWLLHALSDFSYLTIHWFFLTDSPSLNPQWVTHILFLTDYYCQTPHCSHLLTDPSLTQSLFSLASLCPLNQWLINCSLGVPFFSFSFFLPLFVCPCLSCTSVGPSSTSFFCKYECDKL